MWTGEEYGRERSVDNELRIEERERKIRGRKAVNLR